MPRTQANAHTHNPTVAAARLVARLRDDDTPVRIVRGATTWATTWCVAAGLPVRHTQGGAQMDASTRARLERLASVRVDESGPVPVWRLEYVGRPAGGSAADRMTVAVPVTPSDSIDDLVAMVRWPEDLRRCGGPHADAAEVRAAVALAVTRAIRHAMGGDAPGDAELGDDLGDDD